MEAQQSIIKTIKVKKEGFKWGQELLKAKAIITALKEEVECYTKQINSQYKLYDIETKILKERNQELAQENENLKVELAGDDARMDKIQQESRKTILKLQAEIALLKRQRPSSP